MEKKYLLGAIVGDILSTTFSDKRYTYGPKKSLISNNSGITGYTVITLGVAKYIMENSHLYEGEIESGRSEKRKQLLADTIVELVKCHQGLEYPEWVKKWLVSGRYTPTKERDSWIAICMTPLIQWFSEIADLESTLRMVTEAVNSITGDKETLRGSLILTTAIYGFYRFDYRVAHDFLASLYKFRWPNRIEDINTKYGWNTSIAKAMELTLCVYCDNFGGNLNDIIKALHKINGLRSLATPLIAVMTECGYNLQFSETSLFRTFLPEDLLEINDEFCEHMEYEGWKRHISDVEDEDEDIEEKYNNLKNENGSIGLGDLLKLL